MSITPSAVVSGTFTNDQGNPVPNITLTFTLAAFSATQYPFGFPMFVNGFGMIGSPSVTAVTNGAGFFTVTLWGNDVIQTANGKGSYYTVSSSPTSQVFYGQYQFLQGGNYNLLTATPLVPFPSQSPITVPPGSQSANLVFAGPTSGTSQPPAFRALVDGDLPGGTTGSGSVVLQTSPTFTGVVSTPNLESILYADQFPGADLGAKINAAFAAAAGAPQEVWVNRNAGTTITTPVVIPTQGVLRFIEGGIYTISTGSSNAGITMSAYSELYGSSGGPQINTTTPAMMLKMGVSQNVPAIINVRGAGCTVSGLVVDGNNANNTAGIGVYVYNSNWVALSFLTVGNCYQHGIVFQSSTVSNNLTSSCRMFKVITYQNNGCGCAATNVADCLVLDCEFETNGSHGLMLNNSPTWRITHCDFGANAGNGLYVYGSAAASSIQANEQIIVGNQFGNNYLNDILILGYDVANSGTVSIGHVISGNSFIGSANRVTGTYAEIALVDGGRCSIVGNFLQASNSPHQELYGMSFTETASTRALSNTVSGNSVSATGWYAGGAPYYDGTTNGAIGQQIPVCGANGIGASLDLYDTASADSTPHKYIRVSAGDFQIINNAGNTVLLSLDENGDVVIPGISQSLQLIATGATPAGASGQLGLGTTSGFGNGSASTAVTTTTKSTGTGPAVPQTIVDYLKITLGGTVYWVPLTQ